MSLILRRATTFPTVLGGLRCQTQCKAFQTRYLSSKPSLYSSARESSALYKQVLPSQSPSLARLYSSAPIAVTQKTQTPGTDSKTKSKDQVPAYDLTFTCKSCLTRSTHRVTKQGFYKGTVLITCPGCKNRHLISDHLQVGE